MMANVIPDDRVMTCVHDDDDDEDAGNRCRAAGWGDHPAVVVVDPRRHPPPQEGIAVLSSCSSQFSEQIERIKAMIHQESTRYACPDYLGKIWGTANQRQPLVVRGTEAAPATGGGGGSKRKERSADGGGNPPPSVESVDQQCREQICEWCYRVVDHFKIRREIVNIAIAYLDRFMSSFDCDRKIFKLAASTALFLAVKLHEPEKFECMSILPELNRGEFQMNHIVDMEKLLLRTLSFHLHPPTVSSFINQFLLLMKPDAFKSDQWTEKENAVRQLSDVACFFAELTVFDYFFVTKKPSHIAIAAILDAMEYDSVSPAQRMAFEAAVSSIVGPNVLWSEEFCSLRKQLWSLHDRNEAASSQPSGEHAERMSAHSPVCVSASSTPRGGAFGGVAQPPPPPPPHPSGAPVAFDPPARVRRVSECDTNRDRNSSHGR